MAARSYAEFRRRMALVTQVPCPQCGQMLPCSRDEDQALRMAHYAVCPGKPAPLLLLPATAGGR